MSKMLNKGYLKLHHKRLYDTEVNEIYNKVINIINRDKKFTFKFNTIIDNIKYKVSGIVIIRFQYMKPHIYFINLKYESENKTYKTSIKIDSSDVYIDTYDFEIINGGKVDISYSAKPKDFESIFKRIDHNQYLTKLILSLFNSTYSHGGMMFPRTIFVESFNK